jgi:hypothetical protein
VAAGERLPTGHRRSDHGGAQGRPELPAKAILLSFDDGYSSFYTRVLPVLRAYNWHALLAPVGVWIDTPLNQPVDLPAPARSDFLTWDQVREISQSGWWKSPRTPTPATKASSPTRKATCSRRRPPTLRSAHQAL